MNPGDPKTHLAGAEMRTTETTSPNGAMSVYYFHGPS